MTDQPKQRKNCPKLHYDHPLPLSLSSQSSSLLLLIGQDIISLSFYLNNCAVWSDKKERRCEIVVNDDDDVDGDVVMIVTKPMSSGCQLEFRTMERVRQAISPVICETCRNYSKKTGRCHMYVCVSVYMSSTH